MSSRTARTLLRCSSILALCSAQAAFGQTTVSSDRSTPIRTSTTGDVTISEDVTLDVEGSAPITIDSGNLVTIEEDAEVIADDADGRSGVIIAAGNNGRIVNDGAIYVLEDFVPDDDDNNGSPDGPVASAMNRVGILGNSTRGRIENNGTVLVEGLNSYGVKLADGWAGTFDNAGSIGVIGDNSIGIHTQEVATDLSIGGSVSVVGAGSQVVVIDGDVAGSLIIDGALTKARSYTNDDGGSYSLSRSQLRVATPAVEVRGSVSGGILFDAPPLNLDSGNDDEDNDGIDDADETTGSITTYGESPALVIGSADAIVIGAGQARDGVFSLGVDGSISASGSYSTFDATAVVIGGQGGSVDLTDGIGVGGSITATTPDASALALLINADSNVPSLYVSGTISAVISSTGEGSAVAVRDLSGTLTEIDNTGTISVTGASEDETVALDLSRNTTGVTIRQYLNAVDADAYADELEDEDYDPNNPTIYARITGDILTGSGDDRVIASTGRIRGDSWLGSGDDSIALSGNAQYIGKIYSETGTFDMTMSDSSIFQGLLDTNNQLAQLTLADDATFSGYTANAEQLSVVVNGGLFQAADGRTLTVDSLNVGSSGAIGIIIDSEEGTASTIEANTATFASGAGVDVAIDDVLGAEGSYTVLTAGTLTGAGDLDLRTDELPLLYSAALDVGTNSIAVTIDRVSAEELGLTVNQAAAYDAILAAAEEDDYLARSILQSDDITALQTQFDALLPNYNGGVFDFVTRSSALSAQRITDRIGFFEEWPVGVWLEPLYFRSNTAGTQGAGFDVNGWGLSGGWEKKFGNLYAGISGSWISGSSKTEDFQSTDLTKYEAAVHLRYQSGQFNAFARAGYFWVSADFVGTFTGEIDDSEFTYGSTAAWSGQGYTGLFGLSYGINAGDRFTLRPKIVLDYYKLDEDGYETSADSDAIALTVGDRASDRISVKPSLIASYRLQSEPENEQPFTIEVEGGYRSVLSGRLGTVTANFEDGDSFTLTPDDYANGWAVEARVRAGAWDHAWQIGVGAEQSNGDIGFTGRASLNVAF